MREAIRAILAGAVELHLSDVSDVDVLQKARIIEEFVQRRGAANTED